MLPRFPVAQPWLGLEFSPDKAASTSPLSSRTTTLIPASLFSANRDVATFGLGGAMASLIFFKIYYYICVLILAILFYKITFCFPLTISLILLRVMLV